MKQKRTFLVAALLALVAAMCVVFASCKAKLEVKWDVDSNITVTVEGYDALPDKVEEGTALKFTLDCKSGYEVESVTAKNEAGKATTIKVSADGSYSYTVSSAVTISVVAQKSVTGIEVKTKPEKLTYIAGENLETKGMVVNKKFADGTEEALKASEYNITGNGAVALGAEGFTVNYKSFSAEVKFTAPVEAQITIDPMAGTVSDSYFSALKARADLHNVTADNDGVITFTYLALTEEVVLPTAEEITPVREGMRYDSWKSTPIGATAGATVTSITSENKISANIEMQWIAVLVNLDSLELVTDKDGTPGVYLKLTATFEAAESANLYLYEGNDKVELVGDKYESDGTGKAQDLYFDLSKLSAMNYQGKWMDVCFKATLGSREFTQSFILDHENPIAVAGASIQDDKWSYTLLTYRPSDGNDYIKLAYQSYVTTHKFEFSGNTMTVSGQLNTTLASLENVTLTDLKAKMTIAGVAGEGNVDKDGKWSISYDITEMTPCGMTVLGDNSLSIVNGETNVLSARLHFTAAMNDYSYGGTQFSNPSYYYNVYRTDSKIAVYYGHMGSDWQNAFYSVVDEGHEIATDLSSAKLQVKEEKAYLVFNGTYGAAYDVNNAEDVNKLKASFYADFCDYANGYATTVLTFGSPATDTTEAVEATMFIEFGENNTFTLSLLLPGTADAGSQYFLHWGASSGDSSNLHPSSIDKTQIVEVGGLKYSLVAGSDLGTANWAGSLLFVSVEAVETAE